jgi:outer membrane protein TolC
LPPSPPAADVRPSAPAEPAAWTLADCLRRAREANHGLRQAGLAVEQARTGIALARAAFLPRIEAMARRDVRSNDMGARLNGMEQITSERAISSAEVALKQPLWDSGSAWFQVRAGRERLAETAALARQARLDLERAVVDAAVAYQDAQRLVALLRDTRGALEGQLRVARDRRANGLAGAEEVLSAELARNQRDQDILGAEHGVDLARSALNRLLARPLGAALELAELPDPQAWVAGIGDAEAQAVAHRPDVQAAAHAAAAAEADIRTAQVQHLPWVGLMAAYDATTNDYVLNPTWWSVGVGVQMTLTDGGATSARVAAARLQLDAARERLAALREEAAFAARRAGLAWEESRRQEALADEAVRLAEENLRISQDRYRQGLITATDLALEEERRTRARTVRLRIHAEAVSAAVALGVAVGRGVEAPGATP